MESKEIKEYADLIKYRQEEADQLYSRICNLKDELYKQEGIKSTLAILLASKSNMNAMEMAQHLHEEIKRLTARKEEIAVEVAKSANELLNIFDKIKEEKRKEDKERAANMKGLRI